MAGREWRPKGEPVEVEDRVWKSELATLAAQTGLAITVCQFPPGASKWNKIEHRLCAHITMNWRGRPLTSHEVVGKTIAATRTSGGLRIEAALDPGDYPTGVAISTQHLDALPLQRHAVHGAWNYTCAPSPPPKLPKRRRGRAGQSRPATPGHARAPGRPAADRHDQRPTAPPDRRAGPGAGGLDPAASQPAARRPSPTGNRQAARQPLFDDAARLLVTLLYQRQVCSMNVLGDLLEVTATCIGDTIKQTRQALEDHGHTVGAATVRFTTTHALRAFLATGIRPARAQLIDQLSDPALTGISRADLHQLTERLVSWQTAQAERITYQRRGGPRQAGTRGGVFPHRISNRERVLLAVLDQRRLGTMDVLADLLDVSRSSIGNAIREIRPLLEQAGHTSTPAPTRTRSAAELLAPVTLPTAPTDTHIPTG